MRVPRIYYETTVSNEYLGQTKYLRAPGEYELRTKAANQQAVWADQEARKRAREAVEQERETKRRAVEGEKERKQRRVEESKAKAEADTEAAQADIQSLRRLLTDGLAAPTGDDWGALAQRPEPQSFTYWEPEPTWLFDEPEPGQSERLLLEKMIPSLLRRLRAQQKAPSEEGLRQARGVLQEEHAAWDRRREASWQRHLQDKTAYHQRREAARAQYEADAARAAKEAERRDEELRQLRRLLADGDGDATARHLRMVLEGSRYPARVSREFDVRYDPNSRVAVVSCWMPNPQAMPTVTEYRYVATRDEIRPVEMKPKERDALYELVIQQIALRSIYEVLAAPDSPHVESVVFNGWVQGIDPKTGKEFTSCILSCMASREQFAALNLAQVSPKECLRGLKALDAGPLAQLAPVRPVLELSREDSRFIESREVLADLSSSDNLAVMEWEAFEHLVRELFEREFCGDGAEVKVTQASRDRGVDAIAFDPDPIRGGKFVIQAKRYNIVVPVAAVRDLYGTMIAEGAVKGILVTTSYYGSDSREFAKDKPITLIDGANLVHMFQKHGYDVRIELQRGVAEE